MNLAALFQLASPALPVGAYSYSQGLESAIDEGIVRDERDLARFVEDGLRLVLGRLEAPLWVRLYRSADDPAAFASWNDWLVATRETRELRAETVQMGFSLRRLLEQLGEAAMPLPDEAEVGFAAAHAWAANCWKIGESEALQAYCFGWAENQVMAALKSAPVGQVAGQRVLLGLRDAIAATVALAQTMEEDDMGMQAPGLAILSSRHEVQYSRLFRS